MRKSLLLILFAVLISLAALASFWGGRKLCMMASERGLGFGQGNWYSALRLDPSQERSLRDLESNFRKEADTLCMDVCREKMNLIQLIKDENAPQEAIHQKVEEIGAIQVRLEKKIVDHILEVRKHLNPAQSQAYIKRIEKELEKSIRQRVFGKITSS